MDNVNMNEETVKEEVKDTFTIFGKEVKKPTKKQIIFGIGFGLLTAGVIYLAVKSSKMADEEYINVVADVIEDTAEAAESVA